MLSKHKGYFLVLSTAIISGVSIFINKFGVSVVSPNIFTFLKNAVVAIFLIALIIAFKDYKLIKKITKKQWWLLLSIGLIGGSIPFLLFFKGLSLMNPAGASFIQKTMFVWIMVLAWIFLKEKITKNYILAGVLLIVGNLFLIKLSAIEFGQGSLLVFIATLFWAVENVISKYTIKNLEPIIVMWGRMFFGSIFIFSFLAYSQQVHLLTTLSLHQVGWSLLTGTILLCYVLTWYSGLKYIQVSEAAIILMLGSPITIGLNAISVGTISVKEVVGMLVIVLGVMSIFGIREAYNKSRKFLIN